MIECLLEMSAKFLPMKYMWVWWSKWLNEWIRKEKTKRDRKCFRIKNERNSKFNIVVILLILLKKSERERQKMSLDKEWEKLSKLYYRDFIKRICAIYLKKNLWTGSSLLN